MTADELLQRFSEGVLLLLFVAVAVRAVRYPRRANLLAAAFFGAIALILTLGWASDLLGRELPDVFSGLLATLLIALAYILLRLANEFERVPAVIMRVAEVGLAIAGILLVVSGDPIPSPVVLFVLAYFVTVQTYVSWRFVVGAWRCVGVVRRRMLAVALGNGLLLLILILAGFSSFAQDFLPDVREGISRIAAVGMGLAYFAGFAPPRFLERAWQAPDIERFLLANASMEPGPVEEVVDKLERSVVHIMGLRSSIMLVDDDGRLWSPTYDAREQDPIPPSSDSLIASRAFRAQTAIFVENALRSDPENVDTYRFFDATTILVAPISTSDRQFGVLAAFGARPSLFAEDDLRLLQMLANTIAVTLRDQELVRERSRLQAQEEVMRLKDDFLSAAAHDLKTPLTTLVAQTQLLQRRALRSPETPADPSGLRRLLDEAQRMRVLVDDLLDSSRVEQPGFLGERAPVDLLALSSHVAAAVATPRHPIEIQGDSVVATVDRGRMRQVLFNLLDNAVKHSPGGGPIEVRVSEEKGLISLKVADEGVGIPASDYDVIFERFRRGSGMSDGRSGGLGLGLFICKRIVEEHGGTISVSSRRGTGSEFTIVLPGNHGTENSAS